MFPALGELPFGVFALNSISVNVCGGVIGPDTQQVADAPCMLCVSHFYICDLTESPQEPS